MIAGPGCPAQDTKLLRRRVSPSLARQIVWIFFGREPTCRPSRPCSLLSRSQLLYAPSLGQLRLSCIFFSPPPCSFLRRAIKLGVGVCLTKLRYLSLLRQRSPRTIVCFIPSWPQCLWLMCCCFPLIVQTRCCEAWVVVAVAAVNLSTSCFFNAVFGKIKVILLKIW